MALTHDYRHSYSPATLAVYQKIFNTAWEHLIATRSPLASAEAANLTRNALAQHIMACAQSGMRGEAILNSVFDRIIASHGEG